MTLKKYKKKRDFKETSEPQGGRSSKDSLAFVIQKHKATRLHYDFRLELNGVLKSWAVPKGPSLDPSDKRFAKMVEDHPYDYKNFEGIIPKGNYGAGNVIIWDEGTYVSLEGGSKREQEKELVEGFKKGDFKFFLNGKKLKGEFVLVRMEDDNWLLIKHKDKFTSTKDILESDYSVRSGKEIEEIGGKEPFSLDPKIYKKAKKEPIPEKIKPMLATLIDRPFDDSDFLFELKWDGYRAIAQVSKNKTLLYSRNFNIFNDKYPALVDGLNKFEKDMVLDGEIVVVDEKGVPHFQWLQNYNGIKGNLVYYVFDILYYDGYSLFKLPLIERKEILSQVILDSPNIKISDHIQEKGKSFFEAVERQGLEGVVAKSGQGEYLPGKRTTEWVKIKAQRRQEAVIGGFTTPRQGRKYFGSLLLGVYENEKFKYIGHSGGGFSEKSLEDLWVKFKRFKTKVNPFELNSDLINKSSWGTPTKIHWLKPHFVCEVKFSEWTDEGIMRQPVFLGLREDKEANEVLKEAEQYFGTEAPKEGEKGSIQGSTKTFEFSNLDKIWWSKEGITKKELIEYYESISEIILPYLADRPENLNRFPDGIKGASFYQKNIGNFKAPWMKTIKIKSDNEDRTIEYIICDDKDTLLYLANLGCIEINPWNSRTKNLDFPDYLVIDLDPEKISFKYVVKTAIEVHKIFDELGIPSFCKTSGATGLHIYVPAQAKYNYEQIRQFAELVAVLVHKKLPEFTSVERKPEKRQGKVYVDYLQNRIGQTLACAYSARPKKGATVSTPLLWEEVNEDLEPEKFTIRNTSDRIEKMGDLWKETLGPGFNMEKALRKIPQLASKTPSI